MTPEQRILRARIAAHSLHASGRTNTVPAREAFERRFLDEVDRDRELPEEERQKRARHARSAYFLKLSMKAAQARRSKSEPSRDNSLADGASESSN